MSLLVLTHSGVSPRPHLPQESRIFHLLGQLIGTEGGDSSGNSTCLKTPQSGLLEEAEAVPAESVRLQWKSTDFCTYTNIWTGKNFWDIALVCYLVMTSIKSDKNFL